MKYLMALLLLAFLVFAGWPYVDLYRLDRALLENNRSDLEALIDLDTLKSRRKQAMQRRVDLTVDSEGTLADMVRDGARWIGQTAVETRIDLDWVRETLRWKGAPEQDAYPSVLRNTTFAFFERPTRFLVRIGDLGDSPIHLRMELHDWQWKVTEVYD